MPYRARFDMGAISFFTHKLPNCSWVEFAADTFEHLVITSAWAAGVCWDEAWNRACKAVGKTMPLPKAKAKSKAKAGAKPKARAS